MENKFRCVNCESKYMPEDDFLIHLQDVHGIERGNNTELPMNYYFVDTDKIYCTVYVSDEILVMGFYKRFVIP
jgi:hypothetical protein